MGLRNSKHSKSYDIAPVADKDFSYKKTPRPLPKVELPAVVKATEEIAEKSVESEVQVQEIQTTTLVVEETAEEPPVAVQQIQATSLMVETTDIKGDDNTQNSGIPSWVNKENFQKLLSKTNPDIKEIITFSASPALAAGENYATLLLRVKMTAKYQDDTTKDYSFMLKVPHENEQMQQMLNGPMNFFISENLIYSDVIPTLEEMYRQAGVDVKIGAKSHQLPTEETNLHYVLLDDLGVDGFKNANRLECLNMDHTLLVLQKLAQLHAASACYAAKNGPYPEVFNRDMNTEFTRGFMGQMFSSFKQPFLENLKTYENGEKYYDAMENFFDNVLEEFIRIRKPNPSHFNAIGHGDSWSNNILFKYADDGKVEKALLVDFQNCQWGSPAHDLLYFIISSVQIDIKLSHFDYFVSYYHQHLTENLNLLKYPLEIPSLREFHMQMIDYGSWATVSSFLTLAIVLVDASDDAKFDNFMAETEEGSGFKKSMYSNPRYRKYITEILPWLHNYGFMDITSNDLDKNTNGFAADVVEVKTEPSSFQYPEWVNESLFIDVIRADFENYQKILKFNVSPATNAGDNYSSIMLKVDIDIELTDHNIKNLSYMLKIPPSGEQAKAMIAMLNSFNKEITAYHEIVTQFEKVYKEQAGIDIVFAPKSYKLTKETECATLVLENLKTKGFKNCDRLEGLDMQHTKAVIKKLAEFHAVSAYVSVFKGRFPKVFEESMYKEETRAVREKMVKPFMDIFTACAKEYENNKEYIDAVLDYANDVTTHMIKAHTIDFSKFNVLNHGDCWTNNIMFQYNEQGEISETRFVDYQLVRYGPPACDLYYFLLSSPKLEIKLEQFDYLISYYHENLKSNLELLKYPHKIPSLRQLHMDLLDHGTLAMSTVMGVMAAVLLEPSDSSNLDNMMGNDESGVAMKKQMFLNKRYRAHAQAIYPWLNMRGLLEFKTELAAKTETPKNFTVPSWVDAEHFEDILKESVDNFEKILSISAKSATNTGDNYASNLLRVKVEAQLKDGTTKTKPFILKLGLETAEGAGMVSLWNFFEKEITMYSKYLREFEKMYQDVGQEFVFGPKYYSFTKDVGNEVLLLEDLSERDFKCGDRREGLDMEHAQCVLRKLAQLHAVSAKYFELNGPYPEKFQKGIYSEDTRKMFENIKLDLSKYFKSYEGYEEYKDKLPYLMDNHVDIAIRNSTIDPTEFNVLNHGDSWLNNVMFKHDDKGHVEETYFVDFQVCKYGSPAQDLWYFIMSSVELGIKLDSFDYLIKYYYDHLLENIKLLKYSGNVPSLPELHGILLKYGYTGFSTFSGTTAVCLLEPGANANLENFSAQTPEAEKFRECLFLNDKYKTSAAAVLPWLARRGCMDG